VSRILTLRFLALFVLVVLQLNLIILLRGEPDESMRSAQIAAWVILLYSLFIFSLGLRNFLRVWKKDQKQSIDLDASRNQLVTLDGQLRKQVGAWLHGSVQSKLMKIAREVRGLDAAKANEIANELDEFVENEIRNYSHQLFPPALNISLQVGLSELCEGSAELEMDPSLTEQADSGIRLDQRVLPHESKDVPNRLVLPTSILYAIYRVVEEALSNAKKKQSTTKITVRVEVLGNKIKIVVNDNGEKLMSNSEGGLGTTLFDVFAKQFGGTWSLRNTTDGVAFQTEYYFEPKTVRNELLTKVKSRE